eukprot:3951758-Prymnesium_polylepis.1
MRVGTRHLPLQFERAGLQVQSWSAAVPRRALQLTSQSECEREVAEREAARAAAARAAVKAAVAR